MPRKRVDLSSLINETQKYNKVIQEDEQVLSTPVEQEALFTEKQISVNTDKHNAISTEIQKTVSAEVQEPVSTHMQKPVNTAMQKPASTEATHKQTIVISEDLAFRLKVHAARRKETIASIATRAFEKLLAEEDN